MLHSEYFLPLFNMYVGFVLFKSSCLLINFTIFFILDLLYWVFSKLWVMFFCFFKYAVILSGCWTSWFYVFECCILLYLLGWIWITYSAYLAPLLRWVSSGVSTKCIIYSRRSLYFRLWELEWFSHLNSRNFYSLQLPDNCSVLWYCSCPVIYF